MPRDPEMSSPVTRAELRAELQQLETRLEQRLEQKLEAKLEQKLEAKLEQKLEAKLEQKLEKLEARLDAKLEAKFEEKLAPYATRAEIEKMFEEKLAPYATKVDLELWAGAIRHELHSRLDVTDRRLESLERKIDNFPQAFAAELARHVNASREEMTSQIRAVDDKYADLPGRVTELERITKPGTR